MKSISGAPATRPIRSASSPCRAGPNQNTSNLGILATGTQRRKKDKAGVVKVFLTASRARSITIITPASSSIFLALLWSFFTSTCNVHVARPRLLEHQRTGAAWTRSTKSGRDRYGSCVAAVESRGRDLGQGTSCGTLLQSATS